MNLVENAKSLDQFFTNKSVAKHLYNVVKDFISKNSIEFDMWLEPSVGDGSFFNLLPHNKVGYDIDKKIPNIIEDDFLTIELAPKKYFTIGNPPFGKNSNLAIAFFNKCAGNSVAIAFIVPRTFKKDSVINKLHDNFNLALEKELPDNSFYIQDELNILTVPCVFQIWVRGDKRDKIKQILTSADFSFTTKNEADFAFQRVGVNAGVIKNKKVFDKIAVQSHYFIKQHKKNVKTILKTISWDIVKFNTAGNPSISKSELIKLYEKHVIKEA
ncbi:SAM-dependent methyltransferase [Candidatus Pacearchaeota archaeon]|nr:SAM-dependent methyltransferase [Candidatus Pacearchaeota archaeon]